jgi:putative pyruvate formate lyase activating enzyme
MTRSERDPLSRYLSILRGKAIPRFQETKAIKVDEEHGRSLLDEKVAQALELWYDCQLCEHRCRVARHHGQVGKCGVSESRISTHFPHFGEETPLVPSYTVFFTGCNLRCVHCQNWDISTRPGDGEHIPPVELARMIESRGMVPPGASSCRGIRNVNWVGGDPTPHLPYVLQVLQELRLNVPQVWNSNMYLTGEALTILDGTMDIYLTDLKYGNDRCAEKLSLVPNYSKIVRRNHIQASRQGEMIVRHLMLPGHLECCTFPVLEWIAQNVPHVAVNVMDQYRPEHLAMNFPDLRRGVTLKEYRLAMERANELDLITI